MPAADVIMPRPLTRFPTLFPDAPWGVSQGGLNEKGLRQSSTGAIFWVDPNYTGVSDLRAGTDPEYPLRTVAAALTKCTDYAGDVIVVMANDVWQYGQGVVRNLPVQEAVTVTVHGVKIVGMSPSGVLGVVWEPTIAGATAITVNAIDCLVEGFLFQGSFDPAIAASYIGAYGDNLTVRNCYFDESVDIGISLEFSWNCDIHHNWFFECDEYGIYNVDAINVAAYNLIHHNYFDNVGLTAVEFSDAIHNKIYSNQFWNTAAAQGLAAPDAFINTVGGSRNYIHDNTLSCLDTVPANGDYSDTCTPDAAAPNTTDAWVNNHCIDAMTSAAP